MKKILGLLTSISILASTSSVVVSCKNDIMSRTYKERLSIDKLNDEKAQNLYKNTFNNIMNKYVRALPEKISSWEDANHLLQDVGYWLNRYVVDDVKQTILNDSKTESDTLRLVREITSTYTVNAVFNNTTLTSTKNENKVIKYNVSINLLSPRDREFLDKWMDFIVVIPVLEYGDNPMDVITEIESSGLGGFDIKPGGDNKFTINSNLKPEEIKSIETIEEIKNYIIEKLDEIDLHEINIYSDINLTVKIKMPNDREFIDGKQKISEIKNLVSSSLIYIYVDLKKEAVNDDNKYIQHYEMQMGMSYPDEGELIDNDTFS